jgi:tetratricopeptide (TPR) repeat protein
MRRLHRSFFPAAIPALMGTLVAAGACVLAPDGGEAPPSDAPRLLEKLGDHRHPISIRSPLGQRYFDQGLILVYGFNHEAAVRAFRAAAELDPECAMCFWGVALALGPNINAPMGPEAGRQAWAAMEEARRLAPGATPREQAYIAALARRYAAEPPSSRASLDLAYAQAMREVHRRFPDDLDAATLLAEALMDLYPWDYWTDEKQPREYTEEILALLESVMEREPDHPGANHYYIHATEEHFPERAVPAAERLSALGLETGHLVHMPSHIYWRVGRYDDALEINRRASAADESFFSWCRAGAFYRAAYYPHNLHFLWAAASAEGRSDIALSTARKLAAATRDQVASFDFLEEFLSIPTLTLLRFGRFDAVLGEPAPDEARPYLTGIWHYARGIALLRTGQLQSAEQELAATRRVAAGDAAQQLVLAGGTASAADLLAIGVAHLEGELRAAQGRDAEAIAALERAVALQDRLVYMEPPPWYFPTRQALGALLLERGRAAEAEAVYREDLAQYPGNGWSLFGLSRSLRGQDKASEADWAERGFQTAWARADVELAASRF